MKNFNSMADDTYNTSQSNLVSGGGANEQLAAQTQAAQQQQLNRDAPNRSSSSRQQLIVDEMSQDLTYLSREAPLDGGESTFGGANSYSQLAGAGREDSVLHMGSELTNENNNNEDRYLQENNQTNNNSNLRSGTSMSSQRQLTASPAQFSYSYNESTLDQLSPDNVDIQKPLQQAGQSSVKPLTANVHSTMPLLKPFLVSFMVDARGGAMRGCRHSGVRVIIPPNSAQMPMRITCRYLRRERLVHPPPLMEGEACASKIMEVGPAGAKFLGPVLIEVPHFASLRGKEREIIILRSDSGEVWREHLVDADERLVEQIIRSAKLSDNTSNSTTTGALQSDQENQQQFNADTTGDGSGGEGGEKRRLTRIVTNEFPQYFAIISRIRQEVHAVGPEGATINSQVVPRVQAIFTDGALTKRIKIGLQGNKSKTTTQQQQQDAARPDSPSTQHDEHQLNGAADQQHLQTADQLNEQRAGAVSPQSNQGSQTPRPASSTGDGAEQVGKHKRPRSRFLACFGAGHGSVDLLNGTGAQTTDDSSAGGDSPRQPCNETLVKQRHILGDVSDSEADLSGSQLSADLANRKSRVKRNASQRIKELEELVPDDYYIEREQPLILNEEPKTYGKRLKSSSAQTDSKLNVNGYLSTSTRWHKSANKKKRGLLPGKRKNKTQLNILLDDDQQQHKAAKQGEQAATLPDSSLDTIDQQQQQQQQQNDDDISLIRDVITSDDHKWRTCTIQTDSDSVTVNYVLAANCPPESATGGAAAAQDDGYASGSGDLNRQSSFGKGLFGFGSGGGDKQSDESKRSRKQRAKKVKKEKGSAGGKKSAALISDEAKPELDTAVVEPVSTSSDLAKKTTLRSETPEVSAALDSSISIEKPSQVVGDNVDEQQQAADISLTYDSSVGPRSVSPISNKELKAKLKLEKRDKEKREKEEKRLLKEQEEAAEKLKKKQEKEAKEAEKLAKEAEKLAKKAEKQAQKAAKKSPSSSKPSTPLPSESISTPVTGAPAKTSSVKFASQLIESDSDLDSFGKEVLKTTTTTTTTLSKESPSAAAVQQEDGRDMVRVSISEKLVSEQQGPVSLESVPVVETVTSNERAISFSDDQSDGHKKASIELEKVQQQQQQEPFSITSADSTPAEQLKPILKQQSTVSTTTSSGTGNADDLQLSSSGDLVSVADKLVSEATEKAVSEANRLSREAKGLSSPGSAPDSPEPSSAQSNSKKELEKQEKERLKKEAKAKLELDKRLAKEAKQLAKETELAKKAQEAEAKKAAKLAKTQLERQAKEAKVEEEKLAKEAKLKLKLELKESKKKAKEEATKKATKKTKKEEKISSDEAAPSAPPVEQVVESKSSTSTSSSSSDDAALSATDQQAIDAKEEKVIAQVESAAQVVADTSAGEESSAVKETVPSEQLDTDKVAVEAAKKQKKVKEPKVKVKKTKKGEKVTATELLKSEESAEPPTSSLDETTATEPATAATGDSNSSSSAKLSFFSRLFSKRAKSPKKIKIKKTKDKKKQQSSDDTAATSTEAAEAKPKQLGSDGKAIILSEMYPSDPYDAESEMILEVNVPKNLIENQSNKHHVTKRQLSDPPATDLIEKVSSTVVVKTVTQSSELSQASDGPTTSPTFGATTIDESLVTTDDHGVVPISGEQVVSLKEQQQQQPVTFDDPEATLVNVSQTVTSDLNDLEVDDDEATENVVSQTIDLAQSSLSESVPAVKVKRSLAELPAEQQSQEQQVNEEAVADEAAGKSLVGTISTDQQQLQQSVVSADTAAKKVAKKIKKSKAELKEEKDRKELEAKLEKEAKKRADEEEKQLKKLAKEEKLRLKVEKKKAESDAKQLAKEAKVKAKFEAKEAKRLLKEDKKKNKKTKKEEDKKQVEPSSSGESAKAATAAAVTSELPKESSEGEKVAEEVERELHQALNSMTPINTETEVQRIVEEVVGEDGVVTRTTKTVETKYVTLRSEEVHLGEVRKMPLEEYERLLAEGGEELVRSTIKNRTSTSAEPQQPVERLDDEQVASTSGKSRTLVKRAIVVEPYEHKELDEIRATPSYFVLDKRPVELEDVDCGSLKKELKKRIKLNQRLIKRAKKVAKSEAKKAKRDARLASNEIAVCDEAAKQARKELKRAMKQAKKASKLAAKQHKKMDKVDKKLAKRQSKIDKRQRKLDKLAAKLAVKEAKKQAKREAKEAKTAKKLSKQQSSSSVSGSRKSIKLEDIGQPVLNSSSRLSLNNNNNNQQQLPSSSSAAGEPEQQVNVNPNTTRMVSLSKTVIERASPISDDIQVEMSLDEQNLNATNGESGEQLFHTILTETVIEHPDGKVTKEVSEQRLTGKEALEAAQRLQQQSAESEEEEIDVVNDLPVIPSKREAISE